MKEEVSKVSIDKAEVDPEPEPEPEPDILSRADEREADYNRNNIPFFYSSQHAEFSGPSYYYGDQEYYRRILMANMEKPGLWSANSHRSSHN